LILGFAYLFSTRALRLATDTLDNEDHLIKRALHQPVQRALIKLGQTQHTGTKPFSAFVHSRVEFFLWVALADAPQRNQLFTARSNRLSLLAMKQ
jgi:hypothetical protein